MYIEMIVYSVEEFNYAQRMTYMRKLYEVITKFSNAIGYKNIKSFGEVKNYISPESLLTNSLGFRDRGCELATFSLEDKRYQHTNKAYTYQALNMLLKFQMFLYKIYGNSIRIVINTSKAPVRYTQVEDIESYFYCVLAQGEYYEREMSISRKLSYKESMAINEYFKDKTSFKPWTVSYYCSTCHEYHPECSYHVELLDYEQLEKMKNMDIREGAAVSELPEYYFG